MKPLKPSLKEKKRYVVFEIYSQEHFDGKLVDREIQSSLSGYLGKKGMSQAGYIFLAKYYNLNKKRGIFRVSAKMINDVKAGMMFLTDIDGKKVVITPILVSGILKRAKEKI